MAMLPITPTLHLTFLLLDVAEAGASPAQMRVDGEASASLVDPHIPSTHRFPSTRHRTRPIAAGPQRRSRRPARRPVLRIQPAHAPRRPTPCSVLSPPAVGVGPEPPLRASGRSSSMQSGGSSRRQQACLQRAAGVRAVRTAQPEARAIRIYIIIKGWGPECQSSKPTCQSAFAPPEG